MTHLAIAWAILHLAWLLDYHKEPTLGASLMTFFALCVVATITAVEIFGK